MLFFIFLLALHFIEATAKTVHLDWNIDWVSAAPDGITRPVIGINGQWPCPQIDINVGDELWIDFHNQLQNETSSIHFHGIFQTGSNQMDGPAMVTQCPIPPGSTFTQKFTINQSGTYWYHAHIAGQYIDGLRGPLIVHDGAAPYASQIHDEIVLTIEDWYHTQAPYLLNYYQSPLNEVLHGGSEPVPNATLINGGQNQEIGIKKKKTYLFRIINMGSFAAQYLQFDQHDMTVVEVDGVYTTPYKVTQLFMTVGQRYSVIVEAKSDSNQNYAIVTSMNEGMFDPGVTRPDLKNNVNISDTYRDVANNPKATAWLVYDKKNPLPAPFTIPYLPFDDIVFIPNDNQALLGPVTDSITLEANFDTNDQGQTRGTFNNISYVPQLVPTLYTALSAPASLVNNHNIYGVNANAFVIPYGGIVELTVVNFDGGAHPFHIHAHDVQVVLRSGPGPIDGPPLTPPPNPKLPKSPMRRDTFLVYGNGYAVVRFKVDNPGVTFFHCHIDWHAEAGMAMTFIEAPTELQKLNLVVPDNHRQACQLQGIKMQGNAAGNTVDWLDLTGAPTEPPLENWGTLVNPPVSRRRMGRRSE